MFIRQRYAFTRRTFYIEFIYWLCRYSTFFNFFHFKHAASSIIEVGYLWTIQDTIYNVAPLPSIVFFVFQKNSMTKNIFTSLCFRFYNSYDHFCPHCLRVKCCSRHDGTSNMACKSQSQYIPFSKLK